MEFNAFCYYAVPPSLAIFGLGMYSFSIDARKMVQSELKGN